MSRGLVTGDEIRQVPMSQRHGAAPSAGRSFTEALNETREDSNHMCCISC